MEFVQKRQTSLPVIHVRGSYYDVGYNVGRTFIGLIKTLIDTHPSLNKEYIPAYNTENGKALYDETYENVKKYYPHYIRELEGLSDGADVPFYKLFLLHIDDVLPDSIKQKSIIQEHETSHGAIGCSSVCLNATSDEILGHTEDAFKEVLNNIYILNAEITESQPEEKFTAFCYAGLLPGYAMGFNKHGLLYSINIISTKCLGQGKLPRTFVTRALLGADSIDSAIEILRCKDCGIADALSVNLTFLHQSAPRKFYNIEVSPTTKAKREATLSVTIIQPGQNIFHANKFLHLKTEENDGPMMDSSIERQKTFEKHTLSDAKSVFNLLGDTSNSKFSIFRSTGAVWTVAVGIFNCKERTWSLYLDNPKISRPIIVIPLDS